MKYSKVNGSLDTIVEDIPYLQKKVEIADKWMPLAFAISAKEDKEDWKNLMIFAKTGKPAYLYDKKYRM